MIEPDIAVSIERCLKVWNNARYKTEQWYPFGPRGFRFKLKSLDFGWGSIIVSQDDHENFEWIHASLAWGEDDPTYAELKLLHESVFTKHRFAYQVFAAASEHISIHDHALHLWGRADGKNELPDFGREGTI